MNHLHEEKLKSHLDKDDKLIWTGKPKTGIVFRSSDIFLIPFSIVWCGFAIFWEYTALSNNVPLPFVLFGVPFILVGLYITVGRFFLDARKRFNTVYGVTQDRIIIKSGIFITEIKSLNIKTLLEIALNERSDNTGTITLSTADSRYTIMQGMEWPGVKQPPRLESIDDVKSVYDRIIAIQRQK